MRILFLTHYFPPEVGAPQTRIFELGNALGARGHDVTALTPFPHYPTGIIPAEYRPALFRREVIGNVKVVRSWVYAVPNRGVVKRLGNHVSFTLSSMLGALATGPADVVVVETPPLFLGFSGYVISRLKRCDYVCNVADPWLASAVALGVLENRAAIRAGEELERFIYAKAARVTTVTRGLYDGLIAHGVPERKLALITNGVDTGYFRPDLDSRNWRARFGGDRKFVVLYAGTHGLTQGLETVLEAARQLRDRPDFHFAFVGDGAERERLEALATEYRLGNVTFYGLQPKAEMPHILAAADACVVPLKDVDLFRGALPSKMFEAMAVGRPLLLSVAGEAAELVGRADSGLCLPPESPAEMAAGVLRLHADPALRRRLGANGRAFVQANFARERLVDRYERVLVETVSRRRSRLRRSASAVGGPS